MGLDSAYVPLSGPQFTPPGRSSLRSHAGIPSSQKIRTHIYLPSGGTYMYADYSFWGCYLVQN